MSEDPAPQDSDYVWVRCRTLHSSGPASWVHMEVFVPHYAEEMDDGDTLLKAVAERFAEDNNTYSEHFRGAEAEFCFPDAKWVKVARRRAQEDVEEAKARARRLRVLASRLKSGEIRAGV